MLPSRRAEREALRREFGRLYLVVSKALCEADPLGLIAIGAPPDEYEPEVGTVLPRLQEARSVDGMNRILHEEFVRWFGADIAGPAELYAPAAQTLWRQRSQFTKPQR